MSQHLLWTHDWGPPEVPSCSLCFGSSGKVPFFRFSSGVGSVNERRSKKEGDSGCIFLFLSFLKESVQTLVGLNVPDYK